MCCVAILIPTTFPAYAKLGVKSHSSLVVEALPLGQLNLMLYQCDCEFFRGRVGGDEIVFATRGGRSSEFISLNGSVIPLERAGPMADPVCRHGARFREVWTAGKTQVWIDQRVTKPGDEACWLKGRMTVRADRYRKVTPIAGACGC